MIAKISADKGVSFDFTNNQKLKESALAIEGKTVNGYIQNDKVTINTNSAKALNSVVGHEVTHVLEGTELYNVLKDSVIKYAESKGEYKAKLQSITKLYEGMEDANVKKELVADLVGDYVFTDEQFVRNLSVNNRNVFQKVYDEIKYLCKVATAGSKEARQLEKVKKTFEQIYRESTPAEKNTTDESGVKYSLAENAEIDVDKVLNNKNYTEDIYLTKNSPSIIASQDGVRNLPMLMKASHIRENIFTEQEAKEMGLKVDKYTNYHGLGKDLFLKILDGLDDVSLAYRGTKNAENSSRRENYFLLISQYKDANQNTINVPVFIDEKGQYNRVFIDTNKIATVFGRDNFNNYIRNEIQKGNLVKIKNRSTQTSELKTPIVSSYSENTSTNIIPNSSGNVNNDIYLDAKKSAEHKEKQFLIIENTNPAPNSYNTWVRADSDIKTFEEALQDEEYQDYDEFNPDYTREMAESAVKSGKITVYSSYPIEQGVFVTPSRMEAESYSGTGEVYEKIVKLSDVAWIDVTQGMYANTKDYNFSLSDSDIAPIKHGNYNVMGADIMLEAGQEEI